MRARPLALSFLVSLALIALAGLAGRVLTVLVLTPDLRGRGDSDFFHQVANLIAQGRGFSDPFALAVTGEELPTAQHPPLFSLLLAVASRLGAESYRSHRLAACLVGAAAIVAIGLLARRLAGDRAGLIAAGLAAVYPVLVSADAAVMSESLFGLGVILSLLAALHARARPTLIAAALLGAVIGLSALVRAEGLVLAPLLALPALAAAGPRRVARLAVAALCCVVVLAPWAARNLAAFERPVLVSTNLGSLLAGANCPATYAGPGIGSWELRCIPRGARDESVASARFADRGLAYAGDHAGRLPVVIAARLGRTFGVFQPLRQARSAEGRAPGLERAGTFAYFLLVPFGLAGLAVLRRRGGPVWMLLVPFALVVVVSVIGYGVPRFRHPADVALVVLAALALDALLARRRPYPAREGVGGAAGAGSAVASPGAGAGRPLTSRFSRSAGRSTA